MLATNLQPIRYSVTTVDGKRIYTIEDENLELESVTTVLRVINRPGLNDWRVKLGREESDRLRDQGGDIGRMAHEAGLRLFKGHGYGSFEWSLLGHPNPEDERARNAVRALDLLRRERDLVPMAAEAFVWSRIYGYAGTLDLAADNGDGTVDIYDWKTSNAIYPEAWLQLAAYAVAWEECHEVPVRRIYPVRLDRGRPDAKSALYEADTFKEYTDDENNPAGIMQAHLAYLHAQYLGEFIKQHGGRY